MSHTFYLRDGNEVSGPVTAQQLRQMVASGTLRKTDYVRAADQDKWYVAGVVKGLFPEAVQSPHPTHPDTPSPRDDSGRLLAPPTEGRIDVEAFERDRRHGRAASSRYR